jgi:anaerobic magnesium-protoporphyrin IX monomethyl ester cyclase
MKRILLIAPPFYRLMGSHFNGLHLGMCYIAAVLKEKGHDVKVYNADYVDSDAYLNQKQLFDNYTSYKAILNDPGHAIWREIKDKIAGFAPELIGIAMLTANYTAAKYIARIAKDIDSKVKIAVGGAHPTLDPEKTLVEKDFDYLVRGEGEITFLELAGDRELAKISGLSFKKDRQPFHNRSRPFIKDLDSLPFPSRDAFLNDTRYMDFGHIITGRGCPFNCAYCASPKLCHRIARFRSVPNVIEELELVKASYNSPIIRFADDTFSLNKLRAIDMCRQIIARGLEIQWLCDTRADRVDGELLTAMKEAGCIRIKIGVESGSERVLKRIRKGVSKEAIRRAVALIKEKQLPLTVYLMAGFPGETNEDLSQTIEFGKELDADYYSLSILAPYYGTKIWSDLQKSNRKIDREHWEYFYHQSQEMLINDDLDPELIRQFWALNDTPQGEKRRV